MLKKNLEEEMFNRINVPCSKCRSNNTELRNIKPWHNFFTKILSDILEVGTIFRCKQHHPLAGNKFLICKDCGHETHLIS